MKISNFLDYYLSDLTISLFLYLNMGHKELITGAEVFAQPFSHCFHIRYYLQFTISLQISLKTFIHFVRVTLIKTI